MSAPENACRFCAPDPHDFLPCYASVLAFPGATGLLDAVVDTEKVGPSPLVHSPVIRSPWFAQDLVPCFTGYCQRCRNVRMLSTLAGEFPTRSAHHVHQIVLMRKLQSAGVLLK